MQSITLETIQAKQSELAEMIHQLQAQGTQDIKIEIHSRTIDLRPGERYAGAILDESGQHKHDLVLMAQRPDGKLDWNDATDWASSIGGALPDRQEQALLYANCKLHLDQSSWHWSSETHKEDASYAWSCGFDVGQGDLRKSYEGSAVAVRRV